MISHGLNNRSSWITQGLNPRRGGVQQFVGVCLAVTLQTNPQLTLSVLTEQPTVATVVGSSVSLVARICTAGVVLDTCV